MPDFDRITSDCGGGASMVVADAPQQVAARDARGREEAVVPLHQVVSCQDPVEVVAGVERRGTLGVVSRPEPALYLAAHALEGGRGDDPLGRAPDADKHVDPGLGPGRRDRARRRRRR